MFERTRIKLTAWYLLIIITISLLFSLIIYSMINVEFISIERRQTEIRKDINTYLSPGPKNFRPIIFVDVHEARIRLITRLALVNLGILIFAGGAGYFLAGRTLRPIRDTLIEQNRFISDSSHELRTPLTALRSEIEVNLMNKKLTLTQARNTLKSNLDEVIQLQVLSDRLLDLARSDEKIVNYSFQETDIAELVNSAIIKTKKMATNKNIKIENKVEKISLKLDPNKITELFVILIDNSIKYSPNKSKINISSKKTRNHIKLSIQDKGKGIHKAELDKIYDRFYRTEESRSEDGFGLGLSIAKKIVEDHNGSIKAESELNKGTTFIISLPI